MRILTLALTALIIMTTHSPAADSANPLASYRWKSRLIILSAPSSNQAQLSEQRARWQKVESEAAERDLILIDLAKKPADEQTAIRQHFKIPTDHFAILLIGKDGGEKERAHAPIHLQHWFAEIDSMPMRRDEIRAKKR